MLDAAATTRGHRRVRVGRLPGSQGPGGRGVRLRKGPRPRRAPHAEGRPRQPPGVPGARQAIKITRWRQETATGRASRQTVYAVTSSTSAYATAQDLARLVREHWSIGASPHKGHDTR